MTETNLGEFDVGTQIRLIGTFRNLADVLTDPTAGTLVIRDKAGAETPVAFGAWVHDSTGVYHYDFTITNVPGRFTVWWHSTATVLVSDKAYFQVRAPGVTSP